jgi:Zn-dependent protease with chaperone function
MSAAKGLASRGAIAVVLTCGFYVLALVIALVLVSAPPFLTFATDKPALGALWLITYPPAWWILQALAARPRRSTPPGITLNPERGAELHAVVAEVAAKLEGSPPDEVRLVWEPTVYVRDERKAKRERSRMLVVGVPYLMCLTVDQLRSTLAHELAHIAGGDTRIGRIWHHMASRLEGVIGRLEDHPLPFRAPFVWYWRFTARVIAGIRRREEVAADRVAVAAYGAAQWRDSFRAEYTGDWFELYWRDEVAPVLDAGFVPPILAGFEMYVAEGAEWIDNQWKVLLEEDSADEYSSHPPLRQRIDTSLPDVPCVIPDMGDRALSLVADPSTLEYDLLEATESGARVTSLRPISWSQVGEEIWLPIWRRRAGQHKMDVAGAMIADVPALVRRAREADEPREITGAIGGLVCLALKDAAWSVSAPPGGDVVVSHGAHSFTPLKATYQLWEGELDPLDWIDRCREMGIEHHPLEPDAAPEAARPQDGRGQDEVALPLAADRRSRVPTVIGMIIVGSLGLLIAFMTATLPLLMDVPLTGVLFSVGVSLGLIALLAWFFAVHVRNALRPAVVRVGPDAVTFDHPAIFKQPLRVEREAVRVVAIDDGEGDRRRDRRLPVHAGSWQHGEGPDARLSWLWTKDQGSMVPYLGISDTRPNATVLFQAPVAAPPIRRECEHGPLKGEAMAGLLVTLADPDAATCLANYGWPIRNLTRADADRLERLFYSSN